MQCEASLKVIEEINSSFVDSDDDETNSSTKSPMADDEDNHAERYEEINENFDDPGDSSSTTRKSIESSIASVNENSSISKTKKNTVASSSISINRSTSMFRLLSIAHESIILRCIAGNSGEHHG